MFGNPFAGTVALNGFAVLDVSDFQQRRPDAGYRVMSFLTWDDGSIGAQNALPVTIAGKPYIVMADEAGGGAFGSCAGEVSQRIPAPHRHHRPGPPHDAAEIRLGVAETANCAAMATAPITSNRTTFPDGGVVDTPGPGFFAHSCHYCRVDDVDDARILACNCFAAGLRFWDIHDIANIKEMAYFKAPAQGTKVLPGSQYANSNTTPDFFRYYDWHTSQPSFPKDRGLDAGEGDVWTTAQDNGFMGDPPVLHGHRLASQRLGRDREDDLVHCHGRWRGEDRWSGLGSPGSERRVRHQRGRLHGQHGRHLPRDRDQHRRPHQERRCDGHRHHPGLVRQRRLQLGFRILRRPVPLSACRVAALASEDLPLP